MTKKKIDRKSLKNYYDDETLKRFMNISAKATLNWLEEANKFFDKILPEKTKKLQQKLKQKGW